MIMFICVPTGFYGAFLAGASFLTTVLIGWQIITSLGVKRTATREARNAVKAYMDTEIPKIRGEAIGTALFNVASQAWRIGDLGNAISGFIKAANSLKNAEGFENEIDTSLDYVNLILNDPRLERKKFKLPSKHIIGYYNMLFNLNDRGMNLAQLFLDKFQISGGGIKEEDTDDVDDGFDL